MEQTLLFEIKSKLADLKLADYFYYLNLLVESDFIESHKEIRIFVLRSYTAELIEPILKTYLILLGYNPRFCFGDYNQYTQEILDPSSRLYAFKPDLVIWLVRIEDLLPDFIYRFGERSNTFWIEEMQEVLRRLSNLIDQLHNNLSVEVILQNIAAPAHPYWGIYDVQQSCSQTWLTQEFNHQLSIVAEKYPTVFIWDYANYLSRKGVENLYDTKQWYLAKNPFKQTAYIDLLKDLMRYIKSALGLTKKCIVLDLDNTLWGGVIGEDGFEGISLGHDYPGSCYVDFQRQLLKLYNRGIILALNSKNNEADVFEVIEKHPDMVLRREHFAAHQINWHDKASNMRALAAELNIGLDSMLFLDDNPVECALVKEQCPECTVVQVSSKPYMMAQLIDGLEDLENIRVTDEDRKKGEMYYAQIGRKELEKTASDLEGFLSSLQMQIKIAMANTFSIPRIAQLTQKTNQFNMTTKRYSEAEITSFTKTPNCFVFSVSYADRFGDNGLIGVFILKIEDDECFIDTFLLSCRVIERTIEQSVVAFMAEFARNKGANFLVGEFIPTAKNKPAGGIYQKLGFALRDNDRFVFDLETKRLEYSPYIKLI